MTYETNRPNIPEDIKRQIRTEAGHMCSVRHCREDIVEFHHIDDNRENNDPENLILLCDKHHKLAHAGRITRKDLRVYKSGLRELPVTGFSVGYHQHDHDLLRGISEIFPYDILCHLREETFGKYVPRSIIEPCDELLRRAGDPLFKFHDTGLEALRKNAIKAAKAFDSHFSEQCGGSDRSEFYEYIDRNRLLTIDPEPDWEYWKQQSKECCRLAQRLCQELLLLRDEIRNY